jgi:hypothetical protein
LLVAAVAQSLWKWLCDSAWVIQNQTRKFTFHIFAHESNDCFSLVISD